MSLFQLHLNATIDFIMAQKKKEIFKPFNSDVGELNLRYKKKIQFLSKLFSKNTIHYIDYANVKGTYFKRRWNLDLIRTKNLLDSFTTTSHVKVYYGTIEENLHSEKIIDIAKNYNYKVFTKSVKNIKIYFDTSSIPLDSALMLKKFIRIPLLKNLNVTDIQNINQILSRLNSQGVTHLVDKKCNFDVEIGVEMLQDANDKSVQNFILWSGDSDFEYPIKKLMELGKNVVVFCTRGTLSWELNELKNQGVTIYHINGIRNLICFDNERTDLESKI